MKRYIGRFLLTLGLCIWLGSLIFFIIGVAPVNFGTAREWNLTGVNPAHPEQVMHWRTTGGEITGRSIARLNLAEWTGFVFCLVGSLLLVNGKRNRVRRFQPVLFLVMGLLLAVYAGWMGNRLQDIRQTEALDFSDASLTKNSAVHQEFDSLHAWYSRLTTINAMLLLLQVGLAAVPDKER